MNYISDIVVWICLGYMKKLNLRQVVVWGFQAFHARRQIKKFMT